MRNGKGAERAAGALSTPAIRFGQDLWTTDGEAQVSYGFSELWVRSGGL